ncbi:MAG: hypothetical protein WDO19_24295 [Bacteroidota bacterium]
MINRTTSGALPDILVVVPPKIIFFNEASFLSTAVRFISFELGIALFSVLYKACCSFVVVLVDQSN